MSYTRHAKILLRIRKYKHDGVVGVAKNTVGSAYGINIVNAIALVVALLLLGLDFDLFYNQISCHSRSLFCPSPFFLKGAYPKKGNIWEEL